MMSDSNDRPKSIPDTDSPRARGGTILSLMTDISEQGDTAPLSSVATPQEMIAGKFPKSKEPVSDDAQALPETTGMITTQPAVVKGKPRRRINPGRNLSRMNTPKRPVTTTMNQCPQTICYNDNTSVRKTIQHETQNQYIIELTPSFRSITIAPPESQSAGHHPHYIAKCFRR